MQIFQVGDCKVIFSVVKYSGRTNDWLTQMQLTVLQIHDFNVAFCWLTVLCE